MTGRHITRRQALECLAALGALPLLGCGAQSDRARLISLRRDLESAARLGRVWLDGQSSAPSHTELVELLCGESGCDAFGGDQDALRRVIAERHRSAFERGDLVSVDGWILSRTEVALYALVALGD